MGYVFMTAACFTCGRLFTFNPLRVPSIRDKDGVRQAVCRCCVDAANAIRLQRGEDPFPIAKDAYDAVDENELP